jgi:hypothetical protein
MNDFNQTSLLNVEVFHSKESLSENVIERGHCKLLNLAPIETSMYMFILEVSAVQKCYCRIKKSCSMRSR